MNIETYFNSMPGVTPIKRGEARRHINFNATDEEYEIIQRLVHHPNLTDYFNTEIQTTMRWLIGALAFDLMEVSDDIQPLAAQIVRANRLASMEISARGIDTYISDRAREFHMLLDDDLAEDALTLYKETVTTIRRQPEPWGKVFENRFFKATEIDRFRNRMVLLSLTDKLLEVEKYAG